MTFGPAIRNPLPRVVYTYAAWFYPAARRILAGRHGHPLIWLEYTWRNVPETVRASVEPDVLKGSGRQIDHPVPCFTPRTVKCHCYFSILFIGHDYYSPWQKNTFPKTI